MHIDICVCVHPLLSRQYLHTLGKVRLSIVCIGPNHKSN